MSDIDFHRFYFEESAQNPEAMHPTSIRLSTSTLADLDAVAGFFTTSRSYVIQTILNKEANALADRIYNETTGDSHETFVALAKNAVEKLTSKESQ